MHEFVYGWQAIVNTMSMKNNVEVRKRAGLQRFALAGINGITLISHIGVTEIMINGTRSYCFGGVSRPPGRRSVICKVRHIILITNLIDLHNSIFLYNPICAAGCNVSRRKVLVQSSLPSVSNSTRI